jgi:sulfur carrier protein
MAIQINGREALVAPGATIASVVAEWADSDRGIAVARNGEVVPKSGWSSERVADGDSIEILSAAAGG